MAFGLKREELNTWKVRVANGEVAFLTHYWYDHRFPNVTSVTKVGCSNLAKLKAWGKKHQLSPEWIDQHPSYPHYDLIGEKQKEILEKENKLEHLKRFSPD